MEQLKRITLLEWIYLAVEFISLRFCRLFYVPKIADEIQMSDKVAVVTGANTGLGKMTVKKLVERGATVIMACRNLEAGQEALDDIKLHTGMDKLVLLQLDLADLTSVVDFAAAVSKKFKDIHLLVNNAGVVKTSDRELTKDGFEMHMGTNHLGHFLLTAAFLEANLLKEGSRVVTVSSHLIFEADLKLDDWMLERTAVFGSLNFIPYNNSKFANCLFNSELAKRLEGTGIGTYAVCPGMMATDAFRYQTLTERFLTRIKLILFGVPVEAACEATLYCSLSKDCENETGKVYHYNRKLSLANKMMAAPDTLTMANELWKMSSEAVDLPKRLKKTQ